MCSDSISLLTAWLEMPLTCHSISEVKSNSLKFFFFCIQVTAADDRRHGAAHLSEWISIPDMIEKVKMRLPEGANVPSAALVRLQFMPRNRNSHTAMTFTERFQVQYKVQVCIIIFLCNVQMWCVLWYRYSRTKIFKISMPVTHF